MNIGVNKIIDIFRIRKDERWPAVVALVYFCLLNVVNVVAYWDRFSVITDNYHRLFVRGYKVSGFDPLTYEVLSQWFPAYDVHRHPLLAFFMYPLNQVNQLLMELTGVNFAIVLTALLLVLCAFYSFVFLHRILHNVIGVKTSLSLLLSAVYFTMGFIMLSAMVPDHFVMSQCCLLLTLWLAGEKLRRGSALNMWQTIALFTVTAGVSLNNGLKIFLAALTTRRKRFFEWHFLLFAVLLPSALMWGVARWEYKTWRLPLEKARHELRLKKDMEAKAKLRQAIADTITDKTKLESTLKAERNRLAKEKYRKDHQQPWNKNTGKPLAKGEFMRWTDVTTDRWTTATENLFGEAIQLHRDHALKDVLKNRPLYVFYKAPWSYVNYTVEALLLLLFAVGVWCGRRSLLMWTALSMFGMDMALHMGLGFGINEIYIMSAHYLFVMPIAMGYIFTKMKHNSRLHTLLVSLVSAIALWLLVWNGLVVLFNV